MQFNGRKEEEEEHDREETGEEAEEKKEEEEGELLTEASNISFSSETKNGLGIGTLD